MKKNLFKFFCLILFSSLLLSSCDELFVENPAGENDEYLVSYEQVKIISQIEIESVFAYLKTIYPDAETISDKSVTGVKVIKITYNTTFQDEDVIASGLVCIPIGTDAYPLLSFQNGTNTLHANAPSVNPDWELYRFLEAVSSTGFVLAIPDYIGFGSTEEKFHPYLDKESTIQCVTDMLRATKELTASHNLSTNMTDELYIAGYSMGGWATLCLQKAIETDYSDEFNLKASACSAGPYDLLFINSHILALENYPMPYFLGYMLDSYTKLGDITNNISDIVNEPYASKIPILYDGTLDGEQINNQLTTSVDDLLTTEYRDGFLANPDFSSVRLTLLNNSVIAWNLTTPLAILHGAEDDFVTPQVSENLYEDFLSKGASENLVQISIFPDIDHPAGIIPCGIASINWFLQIKDSS